MIANPKLKQIICNMKGFEILTIRLAAKTPTFSFLQTLLEFAIGSFKVQSLYPQSNSYVSTVINRSPIATEVLNQASSSGTSATGLMNPEILESLFSALSRTKELHYRINMLRQLQSVVTNGIFYSAKDMLEQEVQKAIKSGIFVWIVEYFKCLEAEQQQTTNDITAESLKKITKMSLSLLSGFIVTELEKKSSKAILILQSIPSEDRMQGMILDRLFKTYCKQTAVQKEPGNTIKNLATVHRVELL